MSLDINLTNVQSKPIVVSANQTAENDRVYHVVANATFTDPTGVNGKGYEVFVRNGTATINSVAYTEGTTILRLFHSGAWVSYLGGGSQDLQQVTNLGSTTTETIIVLDNPSSTNYLSIISNSAVEVANNITLEQTGLFSDKIEIIKNELSISRGGNFKISNVTSPNFVTLEFPNKTTGSYTIATTADIPSVSGFVPYTGATADVNLGTFHLDAGKGTFTHNGSTDTLTANHTSGSGIGLLITKGGNNEGLKVNKTSGSGNAATIIGTLEATTIVKTGGTSSQYLMADGSTNTLNQASILSLLGFFISKTTTPSSNVTGITETIVNSIAIGGNKLASSDKLIIDSDFVKTTTLGQYALRYYLAPNSNNLTGAVQIAVASAIGLTTAYIPSFFRSFTIDGGNLKGFPFSQSVLIPAATVNAMGTTAFNVANTFYIITTITLNNALDSAYLNSQTIKNF
jgi:hypothetical protein